MIIFIVLWYNLGRNRKNYKNVKYPQTKFKFELVGSFFELFKMDNGTNNTNSVLRKLDN